MENLADRNSRTDSTVVDLALDREWQCGPAFLQLEQESWPFQQKFADRKTRVGVPQDEPEVLKKYRGMGGMKLYMTDLREDTASKLVLEDSIFKAAFRRRLEVSGPGSLNNHVLEHFQHGFCINNWEKLLRRTGNLFKWRLVKTGCVGLEGAMKQAAVEFWIQAAMPATWKAGQRGKLKHLTPEQHPKYKDMLVIKGRATRGLEILYEVDFLPIIMASTRTAELVMQWAHCVDYSSVDCTYATSAQVAWVVGGRALAKKIKEGCVRCRFLGQRMASLPVELQLPCLPFTQLGVDQAGPFIMKRVP